MLLSKPHVRYASIPLTTATPRDSRAREIDHGYLGRNREEDPIQDKDFQHCLCTPFLWGNRKHVLEISPPGFGKFSSRWLRRYKRAGKSYEPDGRWREL